MGITPERSEVIYNLIKDSTNISVTLTNDVTNIGNSAFKDCSGLISISAPSVTNVGSSAFANCKSLTFLNIPNIENIGDSAFIHCDGIKTAKLSDALTSIGQSAFEGCSNIKSAVIPNTTKAIGSRAFYGCSRMENIDIETPEITEYGDSVFGGCNYLFDVYLYSTDPILISKLKFQHKSTYYATLHVPTGCAKKYRAIGSWSNFGQIVEFNTEERIPTLGINKGVYSNNSATSYYTQDGKRISKPQRGLNIVRMSDGTVRKVMY